MGQISELPAEKGIFADVRLLILNSEIETTDSADFTDFEEVIGDERTNLFVAKLQGIDNCNLLCPCNLRNLWLDPFSVFGLMGATVSLSGNEQIFTVMH
jgi:hypothetical protein